MLGVMMLAAVVAHGGGGDTAYRAWRACIGRSTRTAAEDGRLPEEMPVLLREACPNERARFAGTVPAATATARADALINNYVRRYAMFYTTGLWPER